MKKTFIRIISLLVAVSCLAVCLGCAEQTKDATKKEPQSETNNEQTVVDQYVNESTDPNDYDIPTTKEKAFKMTCVSYKTLGKTHFIDAFEGTGEEGYYIILPESVDISNVAIYFNLPNINVEVNDVAVEQKIHFFDFSQNDTASLSIFTKAGKLTQETTLKVMYSAASVMYLDFDESLGTIKAMQSDKNKNKHAYGTMYLDSDDDSLDLVSYFDIHGHGNATWKADPTQKLPYNIKFTEDDTYEKGRTVSPLGMRANSKWCLLSNAGETSLSRTRVAHYISKQVGIDYAIQCEYTTLYLGSQYVGAYYLIEKPANVEDALDLELATGDNMDGSWIVEVDNHKSDTNQFYIDGVRFTVKSAIEGCKYNAIKGYLGEVSTALNHSKGLNKTTGKYYYDYIDLESFAKYLLVRDFCLDYDLVVSIWMYYDEEEGKLNAGPVWDFDNSMWKCGGMSGHLSMYKDTDKLLVMQDQKGKGCWLIELMKYKKFTDILKSEYEKCAYLFDLEDERCIFNVYESWFDQMKLIAEQDNLRWNFLEKTSPIVGYEYDNSIYAPHFGKVANFLHDRCRDFGKAIKRYANGTK